MSRCNEAHHFQVGRWSGSARSLADVHQLLEALLFREDEDCNGVDGRGVRECEYQMLDAPF